MIVINSLRQLMRTPVKTLTFFILLILAVTFFMLGFQLWAGARDNIERIDKAYTTIGTVEQKGTIQRTDRMWDAQTKSYTYFTVAAYDGMIPESVLDFEGADYIVKPEKRPCYGAYMPGFVMSTQPLWEAAYDNYILIAELQPREDCETGDPVCMNVKKVLCGDLKDYVKEVWFCDHWNDTPVKLYADKTYIMSLQQDYHPDFENGYLLFMPSSGVSTSQRDKNGEHITDPVTDWDSNEDDWDVVTEGFYDTPRGKAWQNVISSIEWRKFTIPVMPTQGTKLLMPFFDGDAWILEGRDISKEEYENGDKVCLVQKDFAAGNNLTVDCSLQLPLYIADYRTPMKYFLGGSLLNAKGEIYPVFEDSTYKIVGIYDTLTTSFNEINDYDIAENTVVIPSASVKNSDENNIAGMGPMMGYTTSFQIKNGHIGEFMAAWEKQGISTLEINFFDKGYTKIKAGLDAMMSTASILLVSGGVITLLILVLFCHLFITKQRKRTAIERSLGMTKKQCIASLLTGILVIVIPACLIGSAVSFWLTGYAAEKMTAAHTEQAYDTTFSDWVNGNTEEAFTVSMDNSPGNAWAGTAVIPVALAIALWNIRSNLKREPLKLLGEKER